jgi:hypothetical protein
MHSGAQLLIGLLALTCVRKRASSTGGAASRPRLGVDLTTKLGLTADADNREWKTANNEMALRSQVWGEWVPDADNHRHHRNEDGEILWAAPDWLNQALPNLDRQLVYTVTLKKYKDKGRWHPQDRPDARDWYKRCAKGRFSG